VYWAGRKDFVAICAYAVDARHFFMIGGTADSASSGTGGYDIDVRASGGSSDEGVIEELARRCSFRVVELEGAREEVKEKRFVLLYEQ
jgi:hypothetical protein